MTARRISELTRHDIVDFLAAQQDSLYGRTALIEFLNRVWSLKEMPSSDPRFYTAEGDITQHMLNNDDWDYKYLLWEYLDLKECNDVIFLKLLEACVHPILRLSPDDVSERLAFFNEKLACDGYLLKEVDKMSGRPIYGARSISQTEVVRKPKGNIPAFWLAFHAIIDSLGDDGYLCKSVPGEWCRGYLIDEQKISLLIRERAGCLCWPPSSDAPPDIDTILRLVEMFFPLVAKPKKWWFHEECGRNHPDKFDERSGRYEYTVRVNNAFRCFGLPYQLKKGRVIGVNDTVLDSMLSIEEYGLYDTHLQGLIDHATDSFFDNSGKYKLDGLRTIVEALERLKTNAGQDKKQGAKKLICKVSSDANVRQCFDDHLKQLHKIANGFQIRHNEKGTLPVDEELTDYLFYNYYNLLKFLLKREYKTL